MTRESDVDPDVDDIIERLEDIRLKTGHGLGRVFRDWMALAVDAFEGNDDAYLDRLERYDYDERDDDVLEFVAQTFSEALGELVVATAEAQRPVVGEVYERVGNQADDFGQYFTPWTVCAFKAEMLMHDVDGSAATADDPLTFADPACGSARLLVAGAKKLHDVDPSAPFWVQGTDKDRTCARMAVVNLVIANVPGRIRYGNSLTQEMHREWLVHPSGPGPVVQSRKPDQHVSAKGDTTDAETAESERAPDSESVPEPVVDPDVSVEQAGLEEWS